MAHTKRKPGNQQHQLRGVMLMMHADLLSELDILADSKVLSRSAIVREACKEYLHQQTGASAGQIAAGRPMSKIG